MTGQLVPDESDERKSYRAGQVKAAEARFAAGQREIWEAEDNQQRLIEAATEKATRKQKAKSRTLDEKWEAIPEWLRWIIWLPLALSCTLLASFIASTPSYLFGSFGHEWLSEPSKTYITTVVLLPAIYVLVPRGKKAITSVFFYFIAIFSILAFVKIGYLLWADDQHVGHNDIKEALKAIIWLVFGTGTYQECMRGRFEANGGF